MAIALFPLLLFITSFCQLAVPLTATAQDQNLGSFQDNDFVVADDLNFQDLDTALEMSSKFYAAQASERFDLCGTSVTGRELATAYQTTINYIRGKNGQNISRFLQENYSLCNSTDLLVTGYYCPIVDGSLEPTATYRYPLYQMPASDDLRTASRAQIAESHLLKGHELVYLADPLDAFFLHVQGSGIVLLPDGQQLMVHYSGDNGRTYTSIGNVLINRGALAPEEVSLQSIRAYLAAHPQAMPEIIQQNERYIFFELIDPAPAPAQAPPLPSGSIGYPLTPQRSVAMDADHYPPGSLGLLVGNLPCQLSDDSMTTKACNRLVIHQDSGAAIKGRHRLDLFVGSGPQAGQVAGIMKEKAKYAILIPNLSLRRVHSKIVASTTVSQPPEPGYPDRSRQRGVHETD